MVCETISKINNKVSLLFQRNTHLFLYETNMEWRYERGKCFSEWDKIAFTEIKIYPLGYLLKSDLS